LDSLIPSNRSDGGDGFARVPTEAIVSNPRQPRAGFDDEGLAELAESVRQVGMLQPIVVRSRQHADRDGARFELVAGERRLRAARLVGLEAVPALVRETGDDELLTEALTENIHRTDLSPLEEGAAYRQLLDDLGMTHEALAAKLGKSRAAISNALRLLSLPPELQQRVDEGAVSAGHARCLLALDDPEQQRLLADRVAAEGLSVRHTEELVRQWSQPTREAEPTPHRERDGDAEHTPYRYLQGRLSDALATRVRITGSEHRGRVVIDYAGQEDLERLLAVLAQGTGEDLAEG
jgi:ParB family chromosome partitioning protein